MVEPRIWWRPHTNETSAYDFFPTSDISKPLQDVTHLVRHSHIVAVSSSSTRNNDLMAHEVMVVLELTQERDPIQSSTTHVDIDLHLGRTRVERKLDRWKDVFKAYSSTAAGAGEWWVESLAGCHIGVISSGFDVRKDVFFATELHGSCHEVHGLPATIVIRLKRRANGMSTHLTSTKSSYRR